MKIEIKTVGTGEEIQELKFYRFGQGSPKVFVCAAVHGGEGTSIYVAYEMIRVLKEEKDLCGEVTILPISNPPAFKMLQRNSPIDNMNLNRVFPGDINGSISQKLAACIWEEAIKADYTVDLHCVRSDAITHVISMWQASEKALEFARIIPNPVCVTSHGAPGLLFVELTLKGKYANLIEFPGHGNAGIVDIPAGKRGFDTMLSMLRSLKVIPGKPYKVIPEVLGPTRSVPSPCDGMFLPQVRPGDRVEAGQVLGRVEDCVIKSPYTGVIITLSFRLIHLKTGILQAYRICVSLY